MQRSEVAVARSFRNLQHVQVIEVGELNAYDVLCSDVVVFTTATLPVAEPIGKTARRTAALEGTRRRSRRRAAPSARRPPRRRPAPDRPRRPSRPKAERRSPTRPSRPRTRRRTGRQPRPLEDDEQPEGFPIKGNADSMLYHVPGSRFYNQTKAEVWFATEADAEAAGFSLPASQQAEHDEADQDDAEQDEEES